MVPQRFPRQVIPWADTALGGQEFPDECLLPTTPGCAKVALMRASHRLSDQLSRKAENNTWNKTSGVGLGRLCCRGFRVPSRPRNQSPPVAPQAPGGGLKVQSWVKSTAIVDESGATCVLRRPKIYSWARGADLFTRSKMLACGLCLPCVGARLLARIGVACNEISRTFGSCGIPRPTDSLPKSLSRAYDSSLRTL